MSGGESVPEGYALDDDGNLRADTAGAGEQYGEELEESEEEDEAPEEVEEGSGRGKRRRIANRYYKTSEFWKH
jgi:hypothetical protein